MIISHKHKLIFIKTFKTAGTSLEVFLSPHCGEDDVLAPIFSHIEPHVARNYQGYFNPFPQLWHCMGRRARRILRELIQRKRFYGHINGQVSRDRIPAAIWNSYFRFCVERNPWEKALSYCHMKNYRAGGKLTLEQYFARGKFRTNFEKYTDNKGCLLADEVIWYEELAAGLGRFLKGWALPLMAVLEPVRNPNTAVTGVRTVRC